MIALKRVLYNIIQNLLRYAQNEVSIGFSEINGYFSVTIGNNTITSMPVEVNRIFERFYTADISRSNRSMGLGLYISRKLIDRMGGKMTAYQDNTKLYITITLPTMKVDLGK